MHLFRGQSAAEVVRHFGVAPQRFSERGVSVSPAAKSQTGCRRRNHAQASSSIYNGSVLAGAFRRKRQSKAESAVLSFLECLLFEKREELDESPHAFFLTSGRKSPGPCQF